MGLIGNKAESCPQTSFRALYTYKFTTIYRRLGARKLEAESS